MQRIPRKIDKHNGVVKKEHHTTTPPKKLREE
jgi:hypothetical protein